MRDTSSDVVSATVTTLIIKSLVHPIDTIKCRVQSHPNASFSEFMARWRGRWGLQLYNGLAMKLTVYVPYQTWYMTCYTMAHNASEKTLGDSAVLRNAIAASVSAEIGSIPLRVPMEVAKIRLQSNVYPTTAHAIRDFTTFPQHARRFIVSQTLCHDLPYSLMQWMFMETWRANDLTRHTGAAPFVAGFVCGCGTAVLTCPCDVVRTRVAMSTTKALTPNQAMRQIVTEEGVMRLWRGVSMRVVWIATNTGLFFGVFENVRSLVKGIHEKVR